MLLQLQMMHRSANSTSRCIYSCICNPSCKLSGLQCGRGKQIADHTRYSKLPPYVKHAVQDAAACYKGALGSGSPATFNCMTETSSDKVSSMLSRPTKHAVQGMLSMLCSACQLCCVGHAKDAVQGVASMLCKAWQACCGVQVKCAV